MSKSTCARCDIWHIGPCRALPPRPALACERCNGTGRLWRRSEQVWPYGEDAPNDPPHPMSCGRCAGSGEQRI